MQRSNSSASLKLLDPDLTDGDVFDPPAWLPGRFLQFTDISLEDEPTVRPVSCTAERVVASYEETSEHFVPFRTAESTPSSCVVHMRNTGSPSPRHSFLSQWSRSKVAMMVTSCMTVGLTALTLLTFVL